MGQFRKFVLFFYKCIDNITHAYFVNDPMVIRTDLLMILIIIHTTVNRLSFFFVNVWMIAINGDKYRLAMRD